MMRFFECTVCTVYLNQGIVFGTKLIILDQRLTWISKNQCTHTHTHIIKTHLFLISRQSNKFVSIFYDDWNVFCCCFFFIFRRWCAAIWIYHKIWKWNCIALNPMKPLNKYKCQWIWSGTENYIEICLMNVSRSGTWKT